jgi:hypothetical protein
MGLVLGGLCNYVSKALQQVRVLLLIPKLDQVTSENSGIGFGEITVLHSSSEQNTSE